MPSKNFVTGTVIDATWLNEVNEAVFVTLPEIGDEVVTNVTITPVATGATITVPDGATATISGVNTGDQDISGKANLTANTFTGTQKIPVTHCKMLALGSISGAQNIDLSLASTFTATITGATVFTFINSPPAGYDQTVYLKLTNPGTNVTFVAGTLYDTGVVPTLTTTGRDLLSVWRDSELGACVVGLSFKDYK